MEGENINQSYEDGHSVVQDRKETILRFGVQPIEISGLANGLASIMFCYSLLLVLALSVDASR